VSETCRACMDVETVIGRYAAGCPMTVDGLRDMIRRIIRGHHTEIDRLLAENERLHQERDAWHDLCVHITEYEGTTSIQELEKEVQKRIAEPDHKWFQSSTPAGTGLERSLAEVQRSVATDSVPPSGPPSQGSETGASPKAEAGDTYCICGHSHKWHTSVGKVCWVPKCHCSMFKPASDDTEALDTPRCVHGLDEPHWFSRYPLDSYYGGWCPGPKPKAEGGG
jgi:hypothetical protein